MELLDYGTNAAPVPDECAGLLVEIVPQVMRAIRMEMRRHVADLTVPQFRTLGILRRRPGTSLSDVSVHLGLTLPASSKMVDGLVTRSLVARETSRHDRRRVTLTLTPAGADVLAAVHAHTQAHLAELLGALSPGQRAALVAALEPLRAIFTPDPGESGER